MIVFAVAVLVVVPVFARSRWTSVLVPHLFFCSVPFLLFGLFWLGTHKLGWPALVQPRSRTISGHIAIFLVTFLAVLCLSIVFAFGLAALGSSLFSGDCRGKPLITHPESARHAVFTARVIFVGRSIEALTRNGGLRSLGPDDNRVGDWAIGVVQERFWGVPSRWPHLVLMTDFIYWKGETYFIDGAHSNGLLTRILPIVGARISCSRSRPVQDAIVDLRALREPAPAGSTRLIGYVRKPEVFRNVFATPTSPSFLAGARIDVTGPAGTKTITTDKTGIYQLDGLPSGDYTLQLAAPENQVAGFWKDEGSLAKVHLGSGGLSEYNFALFWNGKIEVRVKDVSGKPARPWLDLLPADGSRLPAYVSSFSNPDGSYQIEKIPPGRYIVMVNPNGPYDGSPYNIQYYPSGWRTEDAQVLELAAGQQIKIEFTVPRLAERTIQVRVTWPNGNLAAGAHICAQYEHTQSYGSTGNANSIKDTDQNGVAVIHVYGNSRVRLFAEQSVENAKENRSYSHYSQPIESEADKIPEKLDLVLTSAKPQQ